MRWVVRAVRRLRGEMALPGDKSLAHRALILGALGQGTTRVMGLPGSRDVQATLEGLRALGVGIRRVDARIEVAGKGPSGLQEPRGPLECRGSATSLRLLAGLLAGRPFYSVLTGNSSLRRRPVDRVADPLRQMGAQILGRQGGRYPPLAIRGALLKGIAYRLPIASAQVKSAVLLAGLQARGSTSLLEPVPTRDHTERLLRAMGGRLENQGQTIHLEPSDLSPLELRLPGDFSSAAYFLAAACLVPDSQLLLRDVGINPRRTGFLEALQQMGSVVHLESIEEEVEPRADLWVEARSLRGIEVGGSWIPRLIDELPLLAVVATQAEGRTVVRDAQELRVKESDRISGVVSQLRRLGARIEERPDGFVVEGPTPLVGARVHSWGDHRLAMSLAVAGLVARGETIIERAEAIADSFPEFGRLLEKVVE